jgi:hypothetical protein
MCRVTDTTSLNTSERRPERQTLLREFKSPIGVPCIMQLRRSLSPFWKSCGASKSNPSTYEVKPRAYKTFVPPSLPLALWTALELYKYSDGVPNCGKSSLNKICPDLGSLGLMSFAPNRVMETNCTPPISTTTLTYTWTTKTDDYFELPTQPNSFQESNSQRDATKLNDQHS